MHDVNWWLMALAFVLGLLLTFALMIRRVTREVPVTHAVSAGLRGGVDAPSVKKPDAAKVAGAVGAAGTAAAAATLHEAGIESVIEKDPYGTGSIRVSARTAAPSGYPIKGDKDTGRYFTADSPEYEVTEAEVWFANEASAEAAGFLRWDAEGDAKAAGLISAATATVITGGGAATSGSAASVADVPAGPYGKGSAKAGADGSGPTGWLIKGNADSMLYHGTDSPAYAQTIAEVWFFDEDSAKAAGFDKWDKNFR